VPLVLLLLLFDIYFDLYIVRKGIIIFMVYYESQRNSNCNANLPTMSDLSFRVMLHNNLAFCRYYCSFL